jgi:uncharacterized protein
MDQPRSSCRNLMVGSVIVVIAGALAVWWFSPSQQAKRRNVALVEAARVGDLKRVEALLNAGADVNSRDAEGITVLMHAVRGQQPNIRDPAPTDHPELVELLIKRGADFNAKTDSGFVALFWAARYGHDRTAKVLIDHGADINARDRDGMNALKWAAANQQDKVLAMLRGAGARE